MDAIIYITDSGSTERHAKLPAHEAGLPVRYFANLSTVPDWYREESGRA